MSIPLENRGQRMPDQAETLMTRSALDLAQMVRSGEVSARELVEAALARIEARRDLNAFTFIDAESALAAADAIHPGDTRPFAGVPTAVKELNASAGQPLTMGSDLFGDYRPTYDAYAIRRLRDAGFVVVGRTAAPEFGIVPVTESRRFGATRNPWETSRTPGGSSGGAGAAVAGAMLPVAQGSDGAGSLRIPAACCGLVGLKPSRGRISRGPDLGDDFLSVDGALTRTVADTARMLDVMQGYEMGDSTWTPPPSEPFAVQAQRPPKRLRVAWTTVSPLGTPVDSQCEGAVESAAELLTSLGHDVYHTTPPGWQAHELQPSFMALWGGGVAMGVRFGAAVTQRDPAPALMEPLTWNFYQLGTTLTAADYAGAKTQLQAHARKLVAFFETYEVLLMPALGQRPVRIGEIDTCSEDPWGAFQRAAVFTPFTPIWNLTGQPAISLPLYQGDDGLPLAVQFAGPPLGEGLLLSLATQLEAALPWADRRAPGT